MNPNQPQFPISHVKVMPNGEETGIKRDAFGDTDEERSINHAQDVYDTSIMNAYNGGDEPIKIDSSKK